MSGELAFIDINGTEVANGYRTMEYLRRGQGGSKWIVPESYPCSILAREVGGVAPFVDPATDNAPWYTASVAESAQFLGFFPTSIDFQTITVTRSTSQRFGGIGGGVIGVEQVAVRQMVVAGLLVASSCPGLEYGRHWINSQIGSDCDGCALGTVRVRESCPPADGSNDTRGEKLLYGAAMISGVSRTDNAGNPCCDYDGITFTLASESPYLYARQGATTGPTTIGTSGGFSPLAPAIVDTFTRANTGPPPSGSWTGIIATGVGETNLLEVVSNACVNSTHTAGQIGSAYWNAATFGPDVAVTIVAPTRVANGQFELRARITGPGTAAADMISMKVWYAGAGQDFMQLARFTPSLTGTAKPWIATSSLATFASGDTYMLTCRGQLIEAWRKPSGGSWARVLSAYDTTAAVAGNVGIAIYQTGTETQTLTQFGAGTLTNAVWPQDVTSVLVPAQTIGILAPIVTIAVSQIALGIGTPISSLIVANAVRVQLKPLLDGACSITDTFGSNNLATNWQTFPSAPGAWAITGGKLKPQTVGTTTALYRTNTGGVSAGYVAMPGGRVQAAVTLGTTLTNGVWGVQMTNGIGVYLVKNNTNNTNAFIISNATNGATTFDTVAFTPVASTTYLIVMEIFINADGTYTVRGYLVDSNNQMLTRPLVAGAVSAAAIGTGPQGAAIPAGIMAPAISTIPADTAEAWDSFFTIDYTDSDEYMEAVMPSGTLVIDTPRRLTTIVKAAGGVAQDASGYISTPIDTPLGWPDVCAGQGAACMQIFADMVPAGGPTTQVSYAFQQRVR